MTPRSSRSSRVRNNPVVQHKDARRGVIPVTNALGERIGDRYSRGMGCRASVANSRTIRYSSGCSISLMGRARIPRNARDSPKK